MKIKEKIEKSIACISNVFKKAWKATKHCLANMLDAMKRNKKMTILISSISGAVVVATIVLLIIFIPSKHTHTFGEWQTQVSATCNATGKQLRTCACGHFEEQTIAATGHAWTLKTTQKEATCQNEGLATYVCTSCQSEKDEAISKKEHAYSVFTEWQENNASYVALACEDCGEKSNVTKGVLFENKELHLDDCAQNFSFEIACEKGEDYIYQNLTIHDSFFLNPDKSEIPEIFVSFNATKTDENHYLITPTNTYEKNTSYTVQLGDGITFSHYPADALIFDVEGEEGAHIEYNENILFLKSLESATPGYYPYQLTYDESTSTHTLVLSQKGVFDESFIGKLLCIGNCATMEEAMALPLGEATVGKISSLSEKNGMLVITLVAPALSEVFNELSVNSGITNIKIEDLSEEQINNLAAQIMQSDGFISAITSAKLTAKSYAEENQVIALDSPLDLDNFEEFKISVVKDENGDPVKPYCAALSVKYNYDIPIEQNGKNLGSIEFTISFKTTFTFVLVIETELKEVDVWDILFDKNALAFDMTLSQTTETDFDFSAQLNIKYTYNQEQYYLINPQSGLIHTATCRMAQGFSNNRACQYTYAEVIKNENYLDCQCKICLPFEMAENGFILNLRTNVLHCANCTHAKQIKHDQVLSFSMYPLGYNFEDCGTCDPKDHIDSLITHMENSIKDSSWEATFNAIKSAVNDELKGNGGSKIENGTQPKFTFEVYCFSIPIFIEPQFNFDLKANASFSFSSEVTDTYLLYLRYNCTEKKYEIHADWRNGIPQNEDYEFNIIGEARTELGILMEIRLTIPGLQHHLYIGLAAEAGIYGEFAGVANANSAGENYYAARVEGGLYFQCSYTCEIPLLLPNGGGGVIKEKQDYSFFQAGDSKAYYAFDDYDQTIYLRSEQSTFVLPTSLLMAHYYDLNTMSTAKEALLLSECDQYSISFRFEDKDGRSVDYCSIENGVLTFSGNAPDTFEIFMYVTVTDLITYDSLVEYLTTYDKNGLALFLNELPVSISRHNCYDANFDSFCDFCGETIESGDVIAHVHDYLIVETVEATCTMDGHVLFACKMSGCESQKTQPLLAPGHIWDDNCICVVCGFEFFSTHDHAYTETVVAPTCSMMGYTLHECACGESFRTDYVDQLGHRWDDGTIVEPKTCQRSGVLRYGCIICHETYDAIIPPSHTWIDIVTKEPTCTEEGALSKKCADCGTVESEIIPAAHMWGEVVVTKANSCTESGAETRTCSKCGSTGHFEIKAHGHRYRNGVCTICGDEFIDHITQNPENSLYGMYFNIDDIVSNYGSEYINRYGVLLNHNADANIEKVGVYLIQDGTMWRRCIACVGTNISYATYVPYLSYGDDIKYSGLSSPWINTFPLSENEYGVWCYSDFVTIGANLADKNGNLLLSLYDIGEAGAQTKIFDDLDEMIAWLLGCDGHVASNWITDTEPTCGKNGIRHKECTKCGYVMEKGSIAKLTTHTESSPVTQNKQEATCVKNGSYDSVVYCAVCEKEISKRTYTISAKGHDFIDGICTVCGDSESTNDKLAFASNGDGTCSVIGIGTCTDTEFVIPSVAPNGDTVIKIDLAAFAGCTTITSVVIPDSVAYIGDEAFQGCSNLKCATIGSGVNYIGYDVVSGCLVLENIEISTENTTYKSIDGSVYSKDGKKMYQYAVGKRNASFTIPDGVIDICFNAFLGCSYLQSIIIPNSVADIYYQAFYNCANLTNVYYKGTPEEWIEIGFGFENDSLYAATLYCYSNTQPTEAGNFWHYVNGEIVVWDAYIAPTTGSVGLKFTSNGDGTCYVSGIGTCTDTEIVIPSVSPEGYAVTGIGSYAFYDCNILTSVTIPDSVTKIGEEVFCRCTSLTSITLSDSVTSIGYRTFYNCSSLTSVTIPDSVTTIGQHAFANCSSLTSVTIGNSVTEIGYSAFCGCNSALYTEYEYGKYVGDSENPYQVLIEITNKNLSTYQIHEDTKIIAYGVFASYTRLTSITIPDSVTVIGEDAFIHCYSLTSVTIPDSVTTIGNYAFTNCSSLTSVTIPDSVTTIGNYAFSNCSSLTSVTIPDSVTTIGAGAFYSCSNLTSVTIGGSVTTIGNYAFEYCSSLTSVYYKGTAEEWNEIHIDSYDFHNFKLTNATRYYYSESAPTVSGNYWHYDADGNIVVW